MQEYIRENKDVRKYSVIKENDQSFLQCCETHISSSLGVHDSYGGETGKGYGPNKTDVKITKVPVSNDYKITDGCLINETEIKRSK